MISYSYLVTNSGNVDVVGAVHGQRRQGDRRGLPGNGEPRPRRVDHLHGVVHDHPGRPRRRFGDQRRLGLERHDDLADRHRDGDRGAVSGVVDREDGDTDHLLAVGAVISYSYLVTNTGNVDVGGAVHGHR